MGHRARHLGSIPTSSLPFTPIPIHSDLKSCPFRRLLSLRSASSSPASLRQPSLHQSLPEPVHHPAWVPALWSDPLPRLHLRPVHVLSLATHAPQLLTTASDSHCLADKSKALRWAWGALSDRSPPLPRPPPSQAFPVVYFPLSPRARSPYTHFVTLLASFRGAFPLTFAWKVLHSLGHPSTYFSRLSQVPPGLP